MSDKRPGGQLDGKGNYLVLTESTRQPDDSWKHNPCDSDIMTAKVFVTIRHPLIPTAGSGEVRRHPIPFCPTCETMPTYGYAIEGETRITLTQWEKNS